MMVYSQKWVRESYNCMSVYALFHFLFVPVAVQSQILNFLWTFCFEVRVEYSKLAEILHKLRTCDPAWYVYRVEEYNKKYFQTFPADFLIPIIFSNLNLNWCNVLDLRNLQEQVKKAKKLQILGLHLRISKKFSRLLEQFWYS